MTDDKPPNVTPLFKPLRKPPASISWGPNFSQMEELGVSSTYVNAFKLQTAQLQQVTSECDLLQIAYDQLNEQFKIMAQQNEMAFAEIDRLAKLRAELQRDGLGAMIKRTHKADTEIEWLRAALREIEAMKWFARPSEIAHAALARGKR